MGDVSDLLRIAAVFVLIAGGFEPLASTFSLEAARYLVTARRR